MQNYKPVLTISVKSEKIVLLLTFAVTLVTLVIVLFIAQSALVKGLMMLLILSSSVYSINKHYLLKKANSANKLLVNSDSVFRIMQNDNQEFNVNIVDKLLIGKYLFLYFVLIDRDENEISENTKVASESISRIIMRLVKALHLDLLLFIGLQRRALLISEVSLGPEKFRQLLRMIQDTKHG